VKISEELSVDSW